MKIFKKKTLYIVLIIVFTLILAADLIIRFGVKDSSQSTRTVPSGFSSGDFNPGNMPSGDFDTSNLPSDFDPSSMQGSDFSGFPGGNMPSGDFDTSNLPSDFDPSSMQGGNMPSGDFSGFDPSSMQGGDFSGFPGGSSDGSFDPTNRPGSTSSSEKKGFIGTVKKFWIPIAVICVLVDAFCAFMILRIKKSEPKGKNGDNRTPRDDEDDEPIRKKSPWLLLLVPVLIIAVVLKMLPTLKKQAEKSSVTVKEKVLSADVATGSISKNYLGGGTLAVEDATSVSVPGEIKIDSYAVENGDMVEEGDLIATVNKASVLSQIKDLQETLSELDSKLDEELDEDDREKITASAGGRVKAIYTEEGKSVVDTMSENNALLVISLDGLMSAELPADGLSVGDPVTVVLPDEDATELSGRVIAILQGTATIAISDEEANMGDEVLIKNRNDAVIGTATLSVHSALNVVAYQGTVEEVNVEVGDQVTIGDDLITLKNAERSSEYIQLMQEREVLSEQMKKLFELYESGEIRAEASGEISGLNEDILLDSDEDEEDALVEYAGYVILNAQEPDSQGDAGAQPQAPAQGDNSGAPQGQDQGQAQVPAQTDTPATGETPSSNETPAQGDNTGAAQTPDQAQTQDPSSQYPDQVQTQDPSSQYPGQSGMPSGFGDGSMSGMPSGMPSGSGNGSSNGGSFATDDTANNSQNTMSQSSYALSETSIYSIALREMMSIDVTVDELDIRNLSEGQQVVVSLDALPGQSFDGEITSIGTEGTYDSGNTKFVVTVSVPKTEQMLSGMNAGIRVEIGESADGLTVPVAALLEKDGKAYVYTIYDEEKDTLDGLTEVTTGVSDGTDVQITSGLSEGDKVYYRYADTLEYTFVMPS